MVYGAGKSSPYAGPTLHLATIVGNCPSWKAQRTKEGVRYKDPKYGRARIVSLSSTIITELKAHHARQAEEQLRLGIRPGDDSFVVAQYDEKPIQPRSLTREWVQIVGKTPLPRTDSHHPRHTHARQMSLAGAHPRRLPASGLGIRRSAPRSTCIPMSCQECGGTRWNRLTSRSGAR